MSWLVSVHAGGLRGVQGRSEWTVSVAAVHRSGLVLAGVVMVPGARMQLEARMGGGASSGGRRLGPLWARPLDREVLGVHLGVGAQGVTSLGRARAQVGEISAGASGAGVLAAVASSGAAGGSGVSGSVGLGWIEDAHASEVAAGMLLVVEAGGVVHVRGQHTLAGAAVVGRGRCSVLAGARRSVARLAEIIEA